MVAYSRSHDKKVLDLYFEAGRQPLPQDDERVCSLSKEIRHPQNSIHMKMANFQWFDPDRKGGLEGGSWQTWEAWCETEAGVNRPPKPGTPYSYYDDMLVLELYLEAGRQPLSQWDSKVFELSKCINHSPKSIHMKMANFQWFDPERKGGLEGGTWKTWEAWCERKGPGVNRPPRPGTPYSVCDDILVLKLYFEAGRQSLSQWDSKVFELSKHIDHSPKSVHRRMANFQWLDLKMTGGLYTKTKQIKKIWDEFAHDRRGLEEAAAKCKREAM